jgi:hypothetical protein
MYRCKEKFANETSIRKKKTLRCMKIIFMKSRPTGKKALAGSSF